MKRTIVPDIVDQQDLWTITPQTTVREAARLMAQRRIGAAMVLSEGHLVGIFSERDLTHRVVAPGLDPDGTRVAAVMTANPVTIGPRDKAGEALELMRTHGFRHLPVVDGGRAVGMVSVRDLYDAVKGQLEEDLQERDAYISGSGYGMTA
ncbi:MAG: CBS domain-containing protein [Pseudomonadota bacterium]